MSRPSERVPFLVTGAAGALGSAVVDGLRARGERVRILVRRRPAEPRAGVEVVLGDLRDAGVVERAVRGAQKVIHAGAAMKGPWPEHWGSTVVGTGHVLEACRRHGVEKLVHVSSLSVVDWAGAPRGAPITEETPLEPRPGERGSYTRAKLDAERAVLRGVAEHGVPAVILRPGHIFGGRFSPLTPAVARRVGGFWVVLGDGRLPLPLVHVWDVVRAILLAADGPLARGEILHIVSPGVLRQEDVVRLALGPDAKVVHIPRPLLLTLARSVEVVLGRLGARSPVSAYRLRSALAERRFESSRAKALLGWEASIAVIDGIQRATLRAAPPLAEQRA